MEIQANWLMGARLSFLCGHSLLALTGIPRSPLESVEKQF
jgi:hypothetical protein